MGFSNSSRNELKRLEHDPVISYRVWPELNDVYKQMTPRYLPREESLSENTQITRQTLIGTCGFLLVLLLVGFMAGFAIRGPAYASTAQTGQVSLAMTDIATPASSETRNNRSKLIATIGSQAPDELLAFDASGANSLSALVRLHDTGAQGSDKLSLLRINPDGSSHEILRQDASDLRATAMAQYPNGSFVTASLHPALLDIRRLGPDGRADWSYQLNTAPDHQAGVKLVALAAGTVIAGPGEQSGQVSVTYLNRDGVLVWQRSFAVDPSMPDIWLAANRDNSVLVATRNHDDPAQASHTLMRVGPEGQALWTAPVQFDARANLAGLVASGDGGAYVLATGSTTSLTRYNATGTPLWDIPVPQANLFNSIHLVATSHGNAVIAVSYALTDDRLDLWLEERGKFGELIGNSSLTIAGLSTVDAVTEASPGRYFLAGSIRPERYEDSDIFIRSFEFKPVLEPVLVMASAPAPAPVLASSAVIDVPDSAPVTVDDSDIEEAAAPPAETTVADAANPAIVEEIDIAQSTPADRLNDTSSSAQITYADSFDDGVAISRFFTANRPPVDRNTSEVLTVRAQCRFSCLERNSTTATFPMWRAIEAPQAAFDAGLPKAHTQTCKAARGVVNPNAQPDCQPY